MSQVTEITQTPFLWSKRESWDKYPTGFVLTLDEGKLFLITKKKVRLIGYVPDYFFTEDDQSELFP